MHPFKKLAVVALTAAAMVGGAVAVATSASAASLLVGPDVSSFQHPNGAAIDWDRVFGAGGQSFAIVKATEGVDFTSPTFGQDWPRLTAKGAIRGTYHYARPSSASGEAVAEARYYVSVAGPMNHPGELPPILDLEETGGLGSAALQGWIQSWLTETQRLTGRRPMIYVSPSFWDDNVKSAGFGAYPLQVAHYTSAAAPRLPLGWSTWTLWQYTDNASVAGISSATDHNRFNGGLAALRALANAGHQADGAAVFRPSAKEWIFRGKGVITNWGEPGDIPVAGDWNGDGVDEPGVFRPSSKTWYLRGSATVTNWGEPGDIPVAGDWNGDGVDEPGVFRPSSKTWYLRGSATVSNWGEVGDVPVAGVWP
jgi:GH25 family lysozyme M1 (1,4-beta-N-acetylmuramidase)